MVHGKLPQPRCLAARRGNQGGAAGGDAANRASCFSPCVWLPRQLHKYQACTYLRVLPQSKHCEFIYSFTFGVFPLGTPLSCLFMDRTGASNYSWINE